MESNQHSRVRGQVDDFTFLRRCLTSPYGSTSEQAQAAVTRIQEQLEALQRDYEDSRKLNTIQHGVLWLVGLDDHEGEQPTTDEVAVENLLRLRRERESNPATSHHS